MGRTSRVVVGISGASGAAYALRLVQLLLASDHEVHLVVSEYGKRLLSDEADVVYKVTAEYSPELDRGILWSDPELGIRWPVHAPIVSPKDAQLPLLKEADHNFVYRDIRR